MQTLWEANDNLLCLSPKLFLWIPSSCLIKRLRKLKPLLDNAPRWCKMLLINNACFSAIDLLVSGEILILWCSHHFTERQFKCCGRQYLPSCREWTNSTRTNNYNYSGDTRSGKGCLPWRWCSSSMYITFSWAQGCLEFSVSGPPSKMEEDWSVTTFSGS